MSAVPRCVVLGAGGHARVLIDAIVAAGSATIVGLLDPDASRRPIDGIRVIGDDAMLDRLRGTDVTHFVVGVGGTGDNMPRHRLFARALAAGLEPLTVRHPSALVSSGARLGRGCQFLPGCIVNVGAVLGSNVIVNSGAIVEHDCVLGDDVHIATGARLASTVTVGAGAHVGVGASIVQCRRIGEWAVVGAGAAVVSDVPPSTIVVGVPARELRPVEST